VTASLSYEDIGASLPSSHSLMMELKSNTWIHGVVPKYKRLMNDIEAKVMDLQFMLPDDDIMKDGTTPVVVSGLGMLLLLPFSYLVSTICVIQFLSC
jgi:hypothetical protein